MPSSLPRRNPQVRLSLLPLEHWPSPHHRWVGFRIKLFEASSNVHLRYGLESSPSHQVARLSRRLRQIRFLLCRFDSYWASDPSQAGLSPAKTLLLPRRTVAGVL